MSTPTTAERTALERAVLARWREGGCAGLIADAVDVARSALLDELETAVKGLDGSPGDLGWRDAVLYEISRRRPSLAKR